MAWNNLSGVQATFQPQGGTGTQILYHYSWPLYLAVGAAAVSVQTTGYTPVTPSQLDTFNGPNMPPPPSMNYTWPGCAEEQHGLNTAYLPHVWFGWGGDSDVSAAPPPAKV